MVACTIGLYVFWSHFVDDVFRHAIVVEFEWIFDPILIS